MTSDSKCIVMDRTQIDAACSCLEESNYSKASEYLQFLKKQFMDESHRFEHGPYVVERLGQSAVPSLISVLEGSTETFEPNSAGVACCVECYRCMRNACAFCTPSQDVLKTSPVFDQTLSLLESCLRLWSTPDLDLLRSVVQFLTNASVGHFRNMMLIWEKFNSKFSELIRLNDEKLTEYTSIAAHTILRGAQECPELADMVPPGLPELARTFTHKLSQDASSWAAMEVYVLEDMLSLENTLKSVLDSLSLEEKVVMMQVLHAILTHELDQEGNPSVSNMKYLAKVFVETAEDLKKTAPHSPEGSQNMKYLKLVLENLCIITSDEHTHEPYCEDQVLLKCALDLLRQVHAGQKEGTPFFSDDPDPENLDPSYGLKKNLVRLVGNMSYKRKENQNLVRELDGIPLLLDLTNFDVKNPYLREWVVFAVRNLCEDNSEVQGLVSNATLQSLTPEAVEFLRTHGLEGHVSGGKITIKPVDK